MFLTMNTVHYRVVLLGKCTPLHAPGLRCPRAGGRRCGPTHEENNILRTQWDLFEDLRSAQDERNQKQMDRLFAHTLGLHGQWQGVAMDSSIPAWAPALDISERKDAYLVTVELPGVKMDDLKVILEDDVLSIQGERHISNDTSEEQYHRVERRYGAFRRSITLPAHVMADAVEASLEDGVLRILVPKAEEAKPKRIEVRVGGGREAIEATAPTS
jgi:HSP20 family protein